MINITVIKLGDANLRAPSDISNITKRPLDPNDDLPSTLSLSLSVKIRCAVPKVVWSRCCFHIILRSDFLSCIHAYTRNLSSAFNPSRLAPVDTHAHGHTSVGSHSQRPGSMGYGALLKGTSAVTRRWTATPPAVSSPIFDWWEWGSNRQPSGWPTLTTEPRPPYKEERLKYTLLVFLSRHIMLSCYSFGVQHMITIDLKSVVRSRAI